MITFRLLSLCGNNFSSAEERERDRARVALPEEVYTIWHVDVMLAPLYECLSRRELVQYSNCRNVR